MHTVRTFDCFIFFDYRAYVFGPLTLPKLVFWPPSQKGGTLQGGMRLLRTTSPELRIRLHCVKQRRGHGEVALIATAAVESEEISGKSSRSISNDTKQWRRLYRAVDAEAKRKELWNRTGK